MSASQISHAPAGLELTAVAGDPFTLLIDVTITDAAGDPIPWSSVQDPEILLLRNGNRAAPSSADPSVTSPQDNRWAIAWTATQTADMSPMSPLTWSLSATINGIGPEALLAGTFALNPSTVPGPSTSAAAGLTVQVGAATAALAVELGAAGVQSVAAADATVTVGGTATAVTVSAAGAQTAAEAFATAVVGTESSRAVAAETELDADLGEEISRALAAEATNAAAITAEATTARAAETELDTDLSEETARAEAAEALLAPQASPTFTGTVTVPDAVNPTDAAQLSDVTDAVAVETARAEGAEATLVPLSSVGAASGVASLDGSGKVPTSELPAITMNTVWPGIASQAAMLALAAEPGDVAVRTDISANFMLAALPASTLVNWAQLADLASPVTSVAGKTGAVTLVEGDISGLVADLAAKAPLASPALTGAPTAPTAGVLDSSTKLATTAYADAAVAVEAVRAAAAEALAVPKAGGTMTGALIGPSLRDHSTRSFARAHFR